MNIFEILSKHYMPNTLLLIKNESVWQWAAFWFCQLTLGIIVNLSFVLLLSTDLAGEHAKCNSKNIKNGTTHYCVYLDVCTYLVLFYGPLFVFLSFGNENKRVVLPCLTFITCMLLYLQNKLDIYFIKLLLFVYLQRTGHWTTLVFTNILVWQLRHFD